MRLKSYNWNNNNIWTNGEWTPCTLNTITTPITTTVDVTHVTNQLFEMRNDWMTQYSLQHELDTEFYTTNDNILNTEQLIKYSDYLSAELDRNIGYSEYLAEKYLDINNKKSVLKGSSNKVIRDIVFDLQSLIDDGYISDILSYHNTIEIMLSTIEKMSNYLEVLQEVNYLVDSNSALKVKSFSLTSIVLEY